MTETRGPAPRAARARQSVLVAVLLTALAVVLTWPAAALLGTTVPDLGDPVLTTWILAWNVHALGTAPLRLFDANMFHPRRGTLAYTEHLLGLVPLVWPVRLLGAEPVLAHNVVWLATFPLTGLALFWLVRHLTGHAGAATLAAVLYAFSHFRFGQLGHVQILSHQWLPLMLLGLHRAAESGGRRRDVGLAAAAFALQALSSGYQAFFAAIAGTLFVAWLVLPSTRPPLGRLVARGALAGALVALLLLPFFLPYRLVRDEMGLARSLDEVALRSARPASYLAAPVVNRWLGDATARFRGEEGALFPGLVALALGLPGAMLAWRGRGAAPGGTPAPTRRWPGVLDVALAAVLVVTAANWLLLGGLSLRLGPFRLSQQHFGAPVLGLALVLAVRRLVQHGPVPVRGLGWLRRLGWPNASGYYVGLTLVGVIASFGPWLDLGERVRLHPVYRQLWALVPGFDALRAPARFGVLVTTGLAVLVGFGAAALARQLPRPGWRAAVLGALGALAVLEAWAVPLPRMTVDPDPGPTDRWLAARPGGPEAVVVLPMYGPRAVHLESLRLLGSTAHWRPLVNGYAGVFPADHLADVTLLNTFPAPAAVARLRAIHVRYVVVHLGQYHPDPRTRLEAALALLPPGVTRVTAFEHSQIFEIGPEGARTSGEPGGADEVPRARERRGLGEARRPERVEALGDGEHGVQAVALREEALAPALLAVDQDHEILDDEARGLEGLDRLQLRGAIRHDVVDDDDPLPGLERPFDAPPGAVRFRLAPWIDEREASGQARGDGEREAGVRDPRDPVDLAARDLRRQQRAHLGQHRRMGDHHPQVDVEGRRGARLQHELAEAQPPDLVEPPDERARARGAHAGISARIAAAAAAGSVAPVIGRPTTR
ncbi:MAG TPA: hypothetical protein VIB60_04805 [Methylomirabilota bacterium]